MHSVVGRPWPQGTSLHGVAGGAGNEGSASLNPNPSRSPQWAPVCLSHTVTLSASPPEPDTSRPSPAPAGTLHAPPPTQPPSGSPGLRAPVGAHLHNRLYSRSPLVQPASSHAPVCTSFPTSLCLRLGSVGPSLRVFAGAVPCTLGSCGLVVRGQVSGHLLGVPSPRAQLGHWEDVVGEPGWLVEHRGRAARVLLFRTPPQGSQGQGSGPGAHAGGSVAPGGLTARPGVSVLEVPPGGLRAGRAPHLRLGPLPPPP